MPQSDSWTGLYTKRLQEFDNPIVLDAGLDHGTRPSDQQLEQPITARQCRHVEEMSPLTMVARSALPLYRCIYNKGFAASLRSDAERARFDASAGNGFGLHHTFNGVDERGRQLVRGRRGHPPLYQCSPLAALAFCALLTVHAGGWFDGGGWFVARRMKVGV